MTTEKVRIDYGLRFACDCGADHEDDVLPRGNAQPVIERVNGHKVIPVQRTVTYSAWEPDTSPKSTSVATDDGNRPIRPERGAE